MEVMAACLRVALMNRPDPTWEPPAGRLFVRISHAPWKNEVVFAYPDGEHHHQSLARIRCWEAEPYFGGWVECARGDVWAAGSGMPIVRRLADTSDVAALVKLWTADKAPGSFRYTIADWLERVGKSGLCDDDKAMIASVVAAGTAAA